MIDANTVQKKKKKKKNKGKGIVTNEELANYNAEDLVNFITGGKRKDVVKKESLSSEQNVNAVKD